MLSHHIHSSAAHNNDNQLEKGGEAFWIKTKTIAHVVESNGHLEIYVLDINFETESEGKAGVLETPEPPKLIAKLPNKSAGNFRYSVSGHLVFSDYVYADGNLTSVGKRDEAQEHRGNSAYVYDTTFVRHWDTWVGDKKLSLFSVRLFQDPDRNWIFGDEFVNLLKGTDHVMLSIYVMSTVSNDNLSRALRWNHSAEQMILTFQRIMLSTRRRILNCLRRGIPSRMSV